MLASSSGAMEVAVGLLGRSQQDAAWTAPGGATLAAAKLEALRAAGGQQAFGVGRRDEMAVAGVAGSGSRTSSPAWKSARQASCSAAEAPAVTDDAAGFDGKPKRCAVPG